MLLPVIQTISTKGQLVIPSAMRNALKMTAGAKVSIMADIDLKTIKVTPLVKDPVKEAWGLLKKYKMKGTFQDSLREKYAEIARGE